MKKSGLNLIGVKEYNRALILQLIATGNGTTRNSLAQRSRLTSMTLTNITSELLQQNIIVESEAPSNSKIWGGRLSSSQSLQLPRSLQEFGFQKTFFSAS